ATYEIVDSLTSRAEKLLSHTIDPDDPDPPVSDISLNVDAAGTMGILSLSKPRLDANTSCTVSVFNALNQLVDTKMAGPGLAVRTVVLSGLAGGSTYRAD